MYKSDAKAVYLSVVAAAVSAAGVTCCVLVTVVVTGRVVVLHKCLREERLDSLVSAARVSAIKCDTCFAHSHLRTAADSAADKHISLNVFQETCKCVMTRTVCADKLLFDYLSVCNIIQLEHLCSAEMLENLSVFIGYCNSHNSHSFLNCVDYITVSDLCQDYNCGLKMKVERFISDEGGIPKKDKGFIVK